MTVHKGLGITVKSFNKGKGNRVPGENHEDYSVLIGVKNKTMLREEWRHVEVLLLDEVSLLSQQLLCEMDHALQFAKEQPEEWFGGINVIFAGDLYQYPPVCGSALYTHISHYAGEREIAKRLGQLAWKTIDTVVSLTEQERMKTDLEYAAAVNRLRIRECNYGDVELFNSRVIKSAEHPHGVDMGTSDNLSAAAIVSTNLLYHFIQFGQSCITQGTGRAEIWSCHMSQAQVIDVLAII